LSVERSVRRAGADEPTIVRLSETLETDAEGRLTDPAEVGRTVARLADELERALASAEVGGGSARRDRTLAELIHAYRPRQGELVDLLADEGELTAGEVATLRAYLESGEVTTAPLRASSSPVPPSPLAAAPLAHDRTPEIPRPVAELLERFEIQNLKQAGAVRARRQISYEEYMALKRHFASSDREGTPTGAAPSPH